MITTLKFFVLLVFMVSISAVIYWAFDPSVGWHKDTLSAVALISGFFLFPIIMNEGL